MSKINKESSIDQSDSGFSQNGQFTPQTGGSLNNIEEGQNYPDNLLFSHLSNQNNHHTGASANIKAENIAKTSIKAQQNSFVFGGKTEDGIVIAAGKSGFSYGQNINAVLTQAQNNISVDTLIGENFKHGALSGPDFQNFLFSQNAGGIAESNFSILNRNALILSGDVIKAVTPLKKVENISNSNSGAFNAGLAESDGLFNNDSGGDGSFNKIVHTGNYTNFTDKMSSSWVFEAISLNHQKIPQSGTLVHLTDSLIDWIDNLERDISSNKSSVKSKEAGKFTVGFTEPLDNTIKLPLDITKHKTHLTNILIDIYKNSSLAPILGFKGGTAAMLFYKLPRFSVDLDFEK